MNIWELKLGQVGVTPQGARYLVVEDTIERRPWIGRVPVRTTVDQNGRIQKFISGIEVELEVGK